MVGDGLGVARGSSLIGRWTGAWRAWSGERSLIGGRWTGRGRRGLEGVAEACARRPASDLCLLLPVSEMAVLGLQDENAPCTLRAGLSGCPGRGASAAQGQRLRAAAKRRGGLAVTTLGPGSSQRTGLAGGGHDLSLGLSGGRSDAPKPRSGDLGLRPMSSEDHEGPRGREEMEQRRGPPSTGTEGTGGPLTCCLSVTRPRCGPGTQRPESVGPAFKKAQVLWK